MFIKLTSFENKMKYVKMKSANNRSLFIRNFFIEKKNQQGLTLTHVIFFCPSDFAFGKC